MAQDRPSSAEESSRSDVVLYHPNEDGPAVTLIRDPERVAVIFSGEREPLSLSAQSLLREHGAPIAQVPTHGIRVYQVEGTRQADTVSVLNRERAVALAAPVLHRHDRAGDDVYVTRGVLVQFRPEVGQDTIEALTAQLNARIIEPLGYAPNGYRLEAAGGAEGLGAFVVAAGLRDSGLVIFAHPDLVSQRHRRSLTVTGAGPSSDVASERAEGDADLVGLQWHLTTARVPEAWNITRGSAAVTIAILDDGVDVIHPEFAGPRLGPQHDFANGSADASPKTGADNHGTACAGVAVAGGVRASGVAPGCTLMAVRFPALLGDAQEAEMFRWAADQGADVISCSWGPADGTGQHDPLPGATAAAIDYCLTSGRDGKGIPIVWAAGNGNESVDLDGYAANPAVMAIAAATQGLERAWYSDFGAAICVAAPSSGDAAAGDPAIVTTDRRDLAGYNDGSEGIAASYTNSFGGTSSAAPLVAGVIGLMLSANGQLTAGQVRATLQASAHKIGGVAAHSPEFGYGLVDAFAAVRMAQSTTTPITNAPGEPSIVGPMLDRSGPPPRFLVQPGSGPARYYAVEVATRSELLDGGDHSEDPGFYASWQDSPFQSTSPYALPQDVWDRMSSSAELYYRAWFSTSSSSWVDTVVTTAGENHQQAPRIALTGSAVPRATSATTRTARLATPNVPAASYAGLDCLAYPGDQVMRDLHANTNMVWTGFYLAPTPAQPDTSWMKKARLLRDMGWGLAPIFKGQPPGGPGSHVVTAAQGLVDAQTAVALAELAEIGEGSVIFLDIEAGGILTDPYLSYCSAWFEGIRASAYRPGVCCSYSQTPDQLRGLHPDLVFWVLNINRYGTVPAPPRNGQFLAPPIAESRCEFATAWRYAQNVSTISVPLGNGSVAALDTVNLDCATERDPSKPQTAVADPEVDLHRPIEPSILGPEVVQRGGPPPVFTVRLPSAAVGWRLETATTIDVFTTRRLRTMRTWWASPVNDPSLTVLALSATAWQRLQTADRLYYRLVASTARYDEPFTAGESSTPDAAVDQAPWLNIENRPPRRERTRGSRTQVLDPDEWNWRARSGVVRPSQ